MDRDIYGMVETCKAVTPTRKRKGDVGKRRRRNFYDYHLRPVPTKVVQDLLLGSKSVKHSIPSVISVSIDVNGRMDDNSNRNFVPQPSDSPLKLTYPTRRSPSVSVTASPSKKSAEICRICYDIIGYESHLIFDVCNHPFHTSCLRKWFQSKKKKREGKGRRNRIKGEKVAIPRKNSRMNNRRRKGHFGKSRCPSCEISSPNALLYRSAELTALTHEMEEEALMTENKNQQELHETGEYTVDDITSDASLDEEILL